MRLRRVAAQRPRGLDRFVPVGEGVNIIADDLALFVTLTSDNENVALAESRNSAADRVRAVADLLGTGTAGENRATYGQRVLAAGIVVRHDDALGQPRGNFSHERALAPVAVAAAAEHDVKTPLDMWAYCGEHRFERIGRMGVVDEDRRTGRSEGDFLEPAGRTSQRCERCEDLFGRVAKADSKTGGDECIRGLKVSRQRQRDV